MGPGCSTTIGHSRDFAPLRVIRLVVLAELPHVSAARIDNLNDNLIDKSARSALRPYRVGGPSDPGSPRGVSGSAHLRVMAPRARATALFLL